MNTVLYKLCLHCVNMMDGHLPFPSTALSEACRMPLYKTRRELKKLKEQGLVRTFIYLSNDDEEFSILKGYTITEKGRKTKEYEKAWQEEREICMKCFGFDIGGVKE